MTLTAFTSLAVPVFVHGLALSLGLIVAIGAQNAFVLRQGLRREQVGSVVLFCAVADTILVALFSISSDDSYFAILMQQVSARREGVVRTEKPGLVVVQQEGAWQVVNRDDRQQFAAFSCCSGADNLPDCAACGMHRS